MIYKKINFTFFILFCGTLFILSCSTSKKVLDINISNNKIDFQHYKTNNVLVGATLNHYELNTKKEELFLKDFKWVIKN